MVVRHQKQGCRTSLEQRESQLDSKHTTRIYLSNINADWKDEGNEKRPSLLADRMISKAKFPNDIAPNFQTFLGIDLNYKGISYLCSKMQDMKYKYRHNPR